MNKHNKFQRILIWAVGLTLAIASLIWIQASASPAAAQGPDADPVDMTIRVEQTDSGLSLSAIGPTPVFNVGDQFKISIVAEGVTEPGIFGSQFEVNFDPVHINAVEGTFESGPAMSPVVVAVNSVDNVAGLAGWAASRQGDVDNVFGDVVLATITLEAMSPTEPPEGATTAITLDNVKLGAKGGIDVPVSGLQGLEVIIRDDGTIPGKGDIVGAVIVEGRAEDNQAGHSVMALGTSEFEEFTNEVGFFFFNNVPDDTYTMVANSAGFLAATCEGVAHTMDALTELVEVQLLAGDIDDDGVIDITDAVAIGAVFGDPSPPEARLIPDLNIDGVVDILDLILMSANYEQTSEGNPWVCQLGSEL